MEEHVSSNISSRSSNEEDSGRIGPPDVILDILSNVGTLIVEPDRLGVCKHFIMMHYFNFIRFSAFLGPIPFIPTDLHSYNVHTIYHVRRSRKVIKSWKLFSRAVRLKKNHGILEDTINEKIFFKGNKKFHSNKTEMIFFHQFFVCVMLSVNKRMR